MPRKKTIKKNKKKCKFCNRSFNKEHYLHYGGNERSMCLDCWAQMRSERKLKIREYLNDFKKKSKCIECGYENPVALQFHHKNPKEKKYTISLMVSQGYPIESIEKEIEKCDILCANCHLIKHQSEKK